MNAIDRIQRTMALERCDRPPVIAQVFAHAAPACGRTVDAYLSSGSVAAACQLEAQARYGYDAVFATIDLTLEAEALGGGLHMRRGLYPAVQRPPFTPDHDFRRASVPDPTRAGRLPMVLEMARALRDARGDEALVVGVVQGPMTLAVQFVGMQEVLCLAADEPDRFLRLLDYTTSVAKAFGVAQLASGAHLVMVFEPAASPEVVPPGLFREMIAPRLAVLFGALSQAGTMGNWLHVAGRTAPILPRYAALGVAIANFDYCVDPGALLRDLGESRICLDGNVKSLAFVTAEPADIERESTELLRLFDRRGGFILSSGCEIPPEARQANVAALVRSAVSWGAGRR